MEAKEKQKWVFEKRGLVLGALIAITFAHSVFAASATKTKNKLAGRASVPTRQGANTQSVLDQKMKNPQNTSLALRSKISGVVVDDALRQVKKAGFSLGADITHFLNTSQTIGAHVSGGAILQTGSSQALYVDEYSPVQTLYLDEATLFLAPSDLFRIEGGAIDQSRLNRPMLVDALPFPGLAQEIGFEKWLRFRAEQTVAMNTQLANQTGDPLGTPYFLFQEMALEDPALKEGSKMKQAFAGRVGAGYFYFSELPRSVAHQSRFLGNSVKGVGSTGAQFVYSYQGFDINAEGLGRLSDRVKLRSSGEVLNNFDAPMGSNLGLLGSVGPEVAVSDKVELAPKLEAFRIQSDVAPAYYNSRDYGHANRQGLGLALELKMPQDLLSLEARISDTKVIEKNPYQADTQVFSMSVRKTYEIF